MILFDPYIRTVIFSGTEGKKIEDLDVEFNIELSSESIPNKANLVIHNLSAQTRRLISDEYQAIEFYAGYKKHEPYLVFRGNIVNAAHVRQGAGFRTTISAQDGEKEYRTKRFSNNYPAGTQYSAIIKAVAAEMGFPIKIEGLLETDTTLLSKSYDGLCKDVLNKICGNFMLEWSIQYGTIEVRYRGDFADDETTATATLINKDTGLLGSPILSQRTDDEAKKKRRKKEKVIWGVDVESLLIPNIKPGRLIQVQSDALDTSALLTTKAKRSGLMDEYCVVQRVTYVGNNFGGEYKTLINADFIPDNEITIRRSFQ